MTRPAMPCTSRNSTSLWMASSLVKQTVSELHSTGLQASHPDDSQLATSILPKQPEPIQQQAAGSELPQQDLGAASRSAAASDLGGRHMHSGGLPEMALQVLPATCVSTRLVLFPQGSSVNVLSLLNQALQPCSCGVTGC